MKMAHTCVRVKDLEASIEFYQKAFGFEESRRRDFPENKFTLVYLTLPGDDYELELTYNYDHGAYDLGDGYGHPEKFLRRFFPVISEFGLDNFFEAAGFEIDCAQHSGRIQLWPI